MRCSLQQGLPVALALAAASFLGGAAPSFAKAEDPPVAPPGVEVQNRGAVHEAFASAVAFNPTSGPVVPKAPPKAIEETLPDEKPEGHVVWIPGYWSWEDERKDFLWISGVWREPPPQRVWVPGYWNTAPGGHQWVSGYWQREAQQAVEYLPTPPASVENGPTSPQVATNYFWVPGHWVWRFNHYVWSPGYWSPYHADWVWVPAHYHWTPAGYVFIPGHWDFPLALRGVCFAPVRFVPGVWGYGPYRPVVMLNLGCMATHLFCGPYHGHYYFGDFYDDMYLTMGYRPWFQYAMFRHGPGCIGYDPLFAYYRVHTHSHDAMWASNLHTVYNTCRTNRHVRPPVIYSPTMKAVADPNFEKVAGVTRINNVLINRAKIDSVALTDAMKSKANLNMANPIKTGMTLQTARKFETLNPALRTQLRTQALQHAEVVKGRISLEKSALTQASAGTTTSRSLTIPSTMRQALVTTRPLTLPKLDLSGTTSTAQTGSTTKSIGKPGPMGTTGTVATGTVATGTAGGAAGTAGTTGTIGSTGKATIKKIEPPTMKKIQPGGTTLRGYNPPDPPKQPKQIESKKFEPPPPSKRGTKRGSAGDD